MIIDNLLYSLGVTTDKASFDKASSSIKDLTDTTIRFTKIAVGAGAAVMGFMTFVNKSTSENTKLADSVHASADTMEALGHSIEGIGLNFENGIDLVEELSNKFGEMKANGEFTAVEESMSALNMKFSDLKDLSPEDQFLKIMDAASQLKDEQEAAFAVDSLMGGEANKILGNLREGGTTLSELVKKYKELNLQTDKSRDGAIAWTDAMRDGTAATTSMGKLFAGLMGGALADMLTQFNDWVRLNNELIKQNITDLVVVMTSAIRTMYEVVSSLYRALSWVVDLFGGWKNVIQDILALGVVFAVAKLIRTFVLLSAALKMASVSGEGLKGTLAGLKNVLLVGAIIAMVDDLKAWYLGGNSIMGLIVGDFDSWKPRFMSGLKQVGALIVDFLLLPINAVIGAVNTVVLGMNKVPGIDVGMLDTVKAGDIFESLKGQATIADFGNYAMQSAAGATNTQNITINVSGSGDPAAVGAVVMDAYKAENQKLQSRVR